MPDNNKETRILMIDDFKLSRLAGFVHGQKRFLGDISHKLNSFCCNVKL